MNSAKIIMHVVKGDRRFQVFELLRKSISQASESAHGHSHREILALDIARGNVLENRLAVNDRLASAHADCGL